MVTLHKTQCCGVAELNNLSSAEGPLDALKDLVEPLKNYLPAGCGIPHPPVFVIFTGTTKTIDKKHAGGRCDNYGQAFADFLVNNSLRDVVASGERVNLTGNTLRLWVWHPNYSHLWSFLVRHGIEV